MARQTIQNSNASLYFDGSSTSIDLGTPSSLINIGDFTFSFWIKSTSKKSAVWGNAYNAGATGQSILLGSSAAGSTGKVTLFQGASSVFDVSDNTVREWQHITVIQSGSLAYIYRNGQVVVNGSALTKVGPTAATHSYIGSANGSTDFLKGNLSNVGIWSRALTSVEILALYNGTTPSSDLIAFYPLNEGAGTVAYDTSGNGNNGTITSGTWTRDTPTKTRKAVGGNMVFNGDFEIAPVVNVATTTGGKWIDGTAGGSGIMIFGWAYYNWVTSYAVKFDTSTSHSGSASLKLSTTNTASTVGVQINAQTASTHRANNIPMLPSTSYTFSCWVKTNVVSGAATTGARVQFMTRTGDGITNVTTTTLATNLLTTQDWTQYTATFTTGATVRFGTPSFQIVGNDGAGTLIMDAWFADIQLYPTTPATRSTATGRGVATGRSAA